MNLNDIFYDWLAKKYGWGESTFQSLDNEFKTSLLKECNEIRQSYGQEIILLEEIV